MRFSKEICRATGVDWESAKGSNSALDELSSGRVAKIEVDDVLIKSKVAWKFAVLRQSLTYRLVDLGEGVVGAWNEQNLLSSVVLARAFLETVALTHSVTLRMRKAVDCRDIDMLDNLVVQESFGTRQLDLIEEHGWPKATNVLTALDHMSKEVDFVRKYYDNVSEIAHPNAFGLGQFYSTIDKEKIITHFSNTKLDPAHIFVKVNVALIFAGWSAAQLKEIDQLVVEIARIHAEIDAADCGKTPHS